MKTLVNKLQLLKTIGVVGVKQSFEDEGAILQDVILMRRITDQSVLLRFPQIYRKQLPMQSRKNLA